ncbi:MAG: DUF4115 domain-containing protein [candidate division KSB1 bacterium]|nr:DUF4115 domain-containing protein [candidate division KSB1 bacterium]MDZ7274042.1 DUF4115 domain-containing protein [candidate division KSB1 bacterium]MDZ7286415.1 DUF4115 domain-containing protein [candidate division KSB1 bacterium]MDZ7296643.1 DUF4115 domain-containing protein [candidate division KSB1 bacterium]MDZ7306865.1 DUF4115 domain-containing protein [candidate division KSB1 bacterium]
MNADAEKNAEIERLRELLLSSDRARVRRLENEVGELRHQLADRESLIASLTPVIGDLLERKIARAGPEMAEIVAPLMGPAIKQQVAESKEEMVEALYPVIGQTVRRAVAEAMRKLVTQINQRLDKAFNLQATWARLKARVLGLPAPLAVIPQVFPFTIEQLFLIDQRSGLLLVHVPAASGGDSNGKLQMVSGMLTAIQDFSREAFGAGQEGDLHEVRYGEKTIFVAVNPPAFLAAVTTGTPPVQFPDKLRGLLRRIHNTWHRELREFAGDASVLQAARQPMHKFITAFSQPAQPEPARSAVGLRPWYRTATAKVALAAVAALMLFSALWRDGQPINPAAPPTGPIVTPTAARESVPLPPPLRLEARVHGRVWMKVITDGRDSTDFIFRRGETYVWHGEQHFRVQVGNAGQTELFLNGNPLGNLGGVQQAVTLQITHQGIIARE